MDKAHAPLDRWNRELGESYSAMMAEPRFPAAARALAANFLAAAGSAEGGLENIYKDAGSYVTAMWVAYLHASGELTLPALKQIGAASGFLSPGRARDLLNLMQHLKYVEVLSPPSGAKPAVYAPTPAFLNLWYGHHRWALEAARRVEPAVELVLAHMDEPRVAKTFARAHAHGLFVASAGNTATSLPFYSVFVHRRAGSQVVSHLAQAGEDAAFPTREIIPIRASDCARRFGVSRIHIKRMLDDAVAEGLLRYEGRDAVMLEDPIRPVLGFHYALQLVHLLSAARDTVAEHPDLAETTPAARRTRG